MFNEHLSIRTDQPLIMHRGKITTQISRFWDQISEGWAAIWGPHIHHGFYDSDMTPLQAQEKLIEKLADLLCLSPQQHILDAGCGMGGSSLYLAQYYDARVRGITLSPKQVQIAELQARKSGIKNVSFCVEDALSLKRFKENTFDIVWSLESCEQFFDKALFFQQAFRVLKPGGKIMLATWCSNSEHYSGILAEKYKKLCLAFDLPYMPSIRFYQQLFRTHGFDLLLTEDWTSHVQKSWDVGVSLLTSWSFLKLINMGGLRGLRFAKQIRLMQQAFHQNRVRYGVFIASKQST